MDDAQQREIAHKGGEASARSQDRDDQGQFTGNDSGSGSRSGSGSSGSGSRSGGSSWSRVPAGSPPHATSPGVPVAPGSCCKVVLPGRCIDGQRSPVRPTREGRVSGCASGSSAPSGGGRRRVPAGNGGGSGLLQRRGRDRRPGPRCHPVLSWVRYRAPHGHPDRVQHSQLGPATRARIDLTKGSSLWIRRSKVRILPRQPTHTVRTLIHARPERL